MTSKARKNKPTRIEKVLPLGKIIGFFRQRFHDPYLNPEAELSFVDFQTGFPEVPREDLEEGLSHWVMRPGARVLCKCGTFMGFTRNTRTWRIP